MKQHKLQVILCVVIAVIILSYTSPVFIIAGEKENDVNSTLSEVTEYFPEIQSIQHPSNSNQAPAAYGTFDFNDGTLQGWSILGPYDEDGDGPFSSWFSGKWGDGVNYPTPGLADPIGDNRGSYQICNVSQHCITNPGATYWYLYWLSPNLSTSSGWQNAGGYTVKILNYNELIGPAPGTHLKIAFSLHVTVYDHDQGRNHYFHSSYKYIPNVFESGSQNWATKSIEFTGDIAAISHKTIVDIMVSIRGEMAVRYFEGGFYLDQIVPSSSSPQISLNTTLLDFGTSENTKTFKISNTGSGTLTWNVAENPNKTWITSISPSSGSGNATIQVGINRSLLSQNEETGSLLVTSNGGNNSVTIKAAKNGTDVYIKNFSSFPAYPYNTSAYKKSGAFVGCGPTTGAMIFGYFQHVNGLSGSTGLLTNPGSGVDEGLNTAWVLHGSTYMNTKSDGFGRPYDIEPGLENYATLRRYKVEVLIHVPNWYSSSSKDFDDYGPYGTSWMNDGIFWSKSGENWDINASKFCDFADAKLAAGVPIFLAIDTDLSGAGDHWVVMVGYNRSTMKYAYYDTYSTELKWADIYYCMKTPHKDNAISYVRTVEYKGQLNTPPRDLVALTGYHGAVPLAWNKPTKTKLLTKSSALKTEESIGDGNLTERYEVYPINRTILNSFSAMAANDLYPTSTHTEAAAPSSYNVYRATSSGGSYTKIASNVTRQYYRDATAANGTTYYYKVTAIYSGSESDYSNIANAAPKTDGYVVNTGWAATAPTLDGVINRSEWEQAATVNITYPGATGTVLLYLMNNSSTLFVAVDDKRDTHQNNGDKVGITFDENLNREWSASGSSDSEGNLWLTWDATTTSATSLFEPCQGYWPDNIIRLTQSRPAGVSTKISMSSGNMQYEGSINLSTSPLNATIGSTIGLQVFSYDKAIENFTGFWPQQAERLKIITLNSFGQAPFSFANVKLTATAPKLAVNPTELDYGDTKTSMTFEITNAATGVLAWTVSENPDKNWITSISPSSGNGRGNVQVVINRNLLLQNVETGTLLVTSNGGNQTVSIKAAKDTLSQWIHKDIEKKLTANDGAEQDQFGISVAIDGIYAAVGAHQDDNEKGVNAGAVYMFTRSGETWTQKAKLVAPDGAAEDLFGVNVDISGDYMVVGACGDDDHGKNSGSAYIYKRSGSTWSMQKKITASDGDVNNLFGSNVAISGKYVIIGAFADSDFGTFSGSAYIFERSATDWIQRKILHASDGAAGDFFGSSVSIDEAYAAVGSQVDDNANGTNAGSVYIYKRSGTDWLEQKKIIASDGAHNDHFYVTALHGDYLAVGAYQDDDKGSLSGSVYVYRRNGDNWIQADKLTASDGAATDKFGGALAIEGNRLIIGASQNDDGAENRGSIYVFENNGVHWTEKQKIIASDGSGDDDFGLPADIDQNYIIVGARDDDDKGADAGAAYIYKLGSMSAITEKPTANEIPNDFIFHQNFPNPFNPETTIQFSLPHTENVNISIYNVQGELITTLVNERRDAGINSVTWNASHETTGLYVCRLQAGKYEKTIKLLLVK